MSVKMFSLVCLFYWVVALSSAVITYHYDLRDFDKKIRDKYIQCLEGKQDKEYCGWYEKLINELGE